MAVESPPTFLQAGSYGAEQTRRAIGMLLQRGATIGSVIGGIVGAGDCTLTAPVSGMSVNIAPGEVVVPGSSSASQSGYGCRVSSSTNLAIAAADPSNPRIDRVSAIVSDAAYAGGVNSFALAIVTGTPTAGATLVNLNGVGAAPVSSYTLGYVLVPATATNIVTADISSVAGVVVDGLPSFAYVNGSGATNAAANQWIEAAAGVTVTLPAAVKNTIIAITAGAGVSGSSQVTVAGTSIQGIGLSSASSFKLGTPGASVVLEADGSNWWIVGGQQDTGWVPVALGTNITSSGDTAARLQGDVIRLKSILQATASIAAAATLGTIPAGLRPVITISLPISAASSVVQATVSSANGSITLPSTALTNGQTVNLDGITYTLT